MIRFLNYKLPFIIIIIIMDFYDILEFVSFIINNIEVYKLYLESHTISKYVKY